MLLALAGLVIRDAKLDFPIEMQLLQKRQKITLSSISLVQTAHRIEPVARQREDRRSWEQQLQDKPVVRDVVVGLWARQLGTALEWLRQYKGCVSAPHLAEP
jgi:hypothetical protein